MRQYLTLKTLLIVVWLGGVLSGFFILDRYKATPGKQGLVQNIWPLISGFKFDETSKNLLVFVHPKCECSKATLYELNQLIQSNPGNLKVHIAFFRPENSDVEWNKSNLWTEAQNIKGATVYDDVDAKEAKLFGAETSGQAYLYGETGNLLFRGGITASRGHIGQSDGRTMITLLLAGKPPPLNVTSAFGCELFNDQKTNKLSFALEKGEHDGAR